MTARAAAVLGPGDRVRYEGADHMVVALAGTSVRLRSDYAMPASPLPHARLLDIDARMAAAAARPVIAPDTIVIDGGKVFVSDTFTRACDRLGISVRRARPHTPTDKPVVESAAGSVPARSVAKTTWPVCRLEP